MTKLLLIVAVTIAIVWLLRRDRRRHESKPAERARQAEDMVRCRVCGVNLPRSEALLSQGRTYCCDEHRRQDH